MHCVASGFSYLNYRWSQLVRIIDVLLYLRKTIVLSYGSVFSMIEIYKHWNAAETFLSFSGTNSLVAEQCTVLLCIKNVRDALENIMCVL